MKKKSLFIILGIIVVIAVAVAVLVMFLNKNKTSMSASEFKTIMESKGYSVLDVTNQFSNYNHVKQVYVAVSSDNSYQVEFLEILDEAYAMVLFNNNKSIFELGKGNVSAETLVSKNNYSKYSLSTDEKFQVVSRIDNTLLYLNVNSDYKDDVKDLLKELGY